MKRVSEHLRELHKVASRHHRAMAEAHRGAMEIESMGGHIHTFHKAAHQAHSEAADSHDAMAQECEKAVAAADLEKRQQIMPTNVSVVAPMPPNIRSVPRFGHPTAQRTPDVPTEFADLVKIEE